MYTQENINYKTVMINRTHREHNRNIEKFSNGWMIRSQRERYGTRAPLRKLSESKIVKYTTIMWGKTNNIVPLCLWLNIIPGSRRVIKRVEFTLSLHRAVTFTTWLSRRLPMGKGRSSGSCEPCT